MGESAVMKWVDRLQVVTGWSGPGWECDWNSVESALGIALPIDYKELCDRFGPGEFSEYLCVAPGEGGGSVLDWWREDQAMFSENLTGAELMFDKYKPFGIEGQSGLLTWGTSQTGGFFFWLADSQEDPDEWPIIARYDMSLDQEWDRYEMSVSEFVYRVIANPGFKFYGVARTIWPPTFRRDPAVPSA